MTGAHTHTRGSMNITGTIDPWTAHSNQHIGTRSATGAFYTLGTGTIISRAETSGNQTYGIGFNASKNWTGSTSSNGAHTYTANSAGAHSHTITSTTITSTSIANNSSVNSIYGKADTVRPTSLGIRVKTRAK